MVAGFPYAPRERLPHLGDDGRHVEHERHLEQLTVRDVVARREARHLRGENEHAHDQRQADGLQQIELEARVVGNLAALDADLFQHGMQLHRVETQVVHEAVDLAVAVVGQQQRSE